MAAVKKKKIPLPALKEKIVKINSTVRKLAKDKSPDVQEKLIRARKRRVRLQKEFTARTVKKNAPRRGK